MIAREVKIEWKGKVYDFTPSNRLIRKIEAEEVSLTRMVDEMGRGVIKLGQLAYVVATVLQSAGVDVTEDDMMAELQGAGAIEVATLASQILAAIFPASAEGKPVAPAAKAAAKKPAQPRGPRRS
jgi:hypothetical protein